MALRADDVDIDRDRDLVDRFQTGQVEAFEDLYARYYERVRRLCMRKVGDVHEAEEIAQETFVRAYTAFPNLHGPRHAYAWLAVVASRLCVDSHRRGAKTQPAGDVDSGEVTVDDDRLETEVDLSHLRLALERLTPRHRDVLALREEREWSYQRIAEHYAVSLGSVEALLFRARHALRREFTAVAGGSRDLAALPVIGPIIGGVLRRAAAFRERIEPLVPALSSMSYAELTTIIALVTTAGLALGEDGPPAPRPAPVALVAGAGPTAFGSAAAGEVSTRSDVDDAPPTGSDASDTSRAGSRPDAEIATPQTMDFDTARRHAEDEPTHASTDRLAVGLDPDEGARETEEATEAYARQLEDWIERSTP